MDAETKRTIIESSLRWRRQRSLYRDDPKCYKHPNDIPYDICRVCNSSVMEYTGVPVYDEGLETYWLYKCPQCGHEETYLE